MNITALSRRNHRKRIAPLVGQQVGCRIQLCGWHPELNHRPAILDKVGTKYAHLRWPGCGAWRVPLEFVVPFAERWGASA